MTTTSTPKNEVTKNEGGVAEWASRIKAMQRQVDEDEEAEQRKLQEEIAASRLKRLRRSQMYGRPETPDAGAETSSQVAPSESTDDLSSSVDRSSAQEDALRKLSGTPRKTQPSSSASTPSSAKESVSLAAFIGGRATGPRLNKHQPQQNAHDPSQFEPRTKVDSPHPVFGRGGVAMPGMTKNARTAATVSQAGSESALEDGPRSFPTRASTTPSAAAQFSLEPTRAFPTKPTYERKLSTPSVAKRYIEQIQDKPIVAQQTGFAAHRARSKSRERTTSTPTGSYSPRSTTPITVKTPPTSRPVSADFTVAKSVSESPSTPSRGTPAGSANVTPLPSPSSNGRMPNHRHSTPPAPRLSSSTSATPFYTPSLARPVLPTPKPTPFGPQVTQTPVVSPAFLRAPAAKAPTPSLSRLKGRGFVQSMVGKSTELQAAAELSPSGTPEKGTPRPKRLSNVLERWPAGTPSPPPSPKLPEHPEQRKPAPPAPAAKVLPQVHVRDFGRVANVAASAGVPIKMVKRKQSAPKLADEARAPVKQKSPTQSPPTKTEDRSVTKKKSFTQPSPAEDVDVAEAAKKQRGIGSSNTLISYIKPMKTGDEPETDAPPRSKTPTTKTPARPKTPQGDADELGLRKKRSAGALRGRVSMPVTLAPAAAMALPSGTPLSHPTKGRAKKPRKGDKPKAETPTTSAASIAGERKAGSEKEDRPFDRVTPKTETGTPAPAVTSTAAATPAKKPSPPVPTTTKPASIAFPASVPSADESALESSRPSRPSKVTDRWALDMPVIGVKPSQPRKTLEGLGSGRPSGEPNTMIRRPLPGMAPSPVSTPTPAPAAPVQEKPSSHERSPSTPRQRVPSTGSRARVMEVAEAFKEHERRSTFREPPPPAAPEPAKEETISVSPEPVVQITPPATVHAPAPPAEEAPALHPLESGPPRLGSPTTEKTERRKSSFNEKYAAVALPPLREETPTATPAGTLARGTKRPEENGVAPEQPVAKAEPKPAAVPANRPAKDEEVQLVLDDISNLPVVDVLKMVQARGPSFKPAADTRVVSLEVMTIAGNAATELKTDTNVFYDMDVLAIIERRKSNASGLVATSVWAWFGKNSQYGEKEERRLQDLAKRYGTALTRVQQYQEPLELLHALGNQLAVRQGSRTHWSSENTAMHVVRSAHGAIFIDEHDLTVTNLCSAFSYCLTILDTLYVWYGCGSTPAERKAALLYGQALGNGASVVELTEGENDDDEMFWMILGSDEYAKAHYWRWRATAGQPESRIWRVDAKGKPPVEYLLSLPDSVTFNTAVHVIDCHWEVYAVVGRHARGNRRSVALALKLAKEFSRRVAMDLPFAPPVHVLVLPSQLPLDLRIALRGLDETRLNDDNLPDHMNILHHSTATYHLQKTHWPRSALEDTRMLPLGVHPSLLP